MEAKDWDVFLETYKDLKDKYLRLQDLAKHVIKELPDIENAQQYIEEFDRIVKDKHG